MQGADRRIAGLWLGLLVFFVYGSWAPLAPVALPPGEAWARFVALPGPWQGAFSRIDLAVNFLLTVPLAFGAAWLVAAQPAPGARRLLAAMLLPALLALSVAVEFGQTFFPPRTPSWSDVAMQALGSGVGLLLHLLFGARARVFVAGLAAVQPLAQRLQRWLWLYLLLLLVWQLMPLDLSISPVELYRKWRDGRVVLLPFSALPSSPWEAAWQLGADLLLWLPVGALGWQVLARPAPARLLVRGLALVAAVELCQLFVLSRVSDVTDLFVGTAGVLGGAALARALQGWAAWPDVRRRRLLHTALAAWLGFVLMVLWLPFDFETARGSAAHWWAAVSRPPLATYFERSEYGALGEILRKLAVFGPGGLLLALLARGERPALWPRALALAALALLLEAGQVLLPSKLADLSDAALGLLGGLLGWRLGRAMVQAPLADASPAPAPAPAAAPAPPRPEVPVRAQAMPPRATRWLGPVGLVLGLAFALWLFARVPGVPYNVAKLMPVSAAGLLSALGVALALAWMLAAPLWLLAERRRAWRLAFPLLLLGHGLVAFVALRLMVPLPMLHKLIGTPVLSWSAFSVLEEAGRYVALHAAFVLPVLGAAWLVRVLTAPAALADLLWWAACSLLLLAPVHAVVVVAAGTDNLVELMRGGGGIGSSLALAAGWGALATAGTALAAAWAAGAPGAVARPAWRRGPLLGLALVAALLAPGLLQAGLEPAVIKYERVFSAAQFLLSAGRDRYAQGPELWLRAGVALTAAGLLVALLQVPAWRQLARGAPRQGAG